MEIANTLQSGTGAMSKMRRGMTSGAVDRVMNDMEDHVDVSKEISDALTAQPGDVVDEDELLEELDELEEEDICDGCEESVRPKAKPRSQYTEEDELAELEAELEGCSYSAPVEKSSPKPAPAPKPKPAPAPMPEPAPAPVSKPAAHMPAAKPSADLSPSLDNIILQQKASGCFNALALQLLGIPDSAKNARPTTLPSGMSAALAEEVWITLLVLAGLEKKFGDKKSEWSFLAQKSEKWVSSKLGAAFDTWKAAAEVAF